MNGFFNKSLTLGWLCVLGAMVFLAGCSAKFTYFKPSHDISRIFENGEILPAHRYYVGGPAEKPNAIVAINEDFTLEGEAWSPISITSESLKKIVKTIGFVSYAEYKAQLVPNGARIISPTGEPIGAWYSVYQYSQIRLLAGRRVTLSYPHAQLPSNLPIPKRS